MNDLPTFGDTHLSYELDQRVQRELGNGEQLLWVGQPQPSRAMWTALPIVLFGIPWTCFALFWMAMASGMLFLGGNGPALNNGFDAFFACFPLFGLPFVVIGLGMLSAPYWVYRKAKKTCYALSNRRAILWQAGFFGSIEVRSFAPDQLKQMRRVEYADGSGNLIFEEQFVLNRDNDGRAWTNRLQHGFMGIERVRDVEELLRKTLLTDTRPAGDAPVS